MVEHEQFSCERKQFSCEGTMPIAVEMRDILIETAAPRQPGETVQAMLARTARKLGLPFARAQSIWYGRARLISAEEADRLRARRRDFARARLAQLQRDIDCQNRIIRGMDHAA